MIGVRFSPLLLIAASLYRRDTRPRKSAVPQALLIGRNRMPGALCSVAAEEHSELA